MSKQPRSQGLSTFPPPWRGGKNRDPGNEVACQRTVNLAQQRIECVIFYVDPKSMGSLNFFGKERSLVVLSKKFAEFAGLKAA